MAKKNQQQTSAPSNLTFKSGTAEFRLEKISLTHWRAVIVDSKGESRWFNFDRQAIKRLKEATADV